jgi:ribA/ribD-fused uncharacterized protein
MEYQVIDKFDGKYAFLSNFYPIKIKFGGLYYPCVENAYQASKSNDWLVRREFGFVTPGQAKRIGRKVQLDKNWETRKVGIMHILLLKKFQDKELKKLLIDTGEATLIEGNNWGDTFWGIDKNGVGENHLGILLMKVREEVKNANKQVL